MSKTAGKEFAEIVGRELDRLSELIASYRDPDSLWNVTGDAQNPPGTLALHLAGNLEHYVGAVLGDTGYLRDRVAEFADRDVPKEEILMTQPLGTVVCACQKLGNLLDQDIVVAGQGPMGLLFTHMLANLGARTVIALDKLDNRREAARQMHATHTGI